MTWIDRRAPWLRVAEGYSGTAEIPGRQTAPTIARWLRELRAWWSDDETPWCGVFVAACLREAGVPGLPVHWYRAKAWLEWGTVLEGPAYGCLVIFDRKGGGHVGFVVGRSTDGRLMVLGGNQSNRVGVAAFGVDRVLGYRWPPAGTLAGAEARASLPLYRHFGESSQSEA